MLPSTNKPKLSLNFLQQILDSGEISPARKILQTCLNEISIDDSNSACFHEIPRITNTNNYEEFFIYMWKNVSE